MRYSLALNKRGVWYVKHSSDLTNPHAKWTTRCTGHVDKTLADEYARAALLGADGTNAAKWQACAQRLNDVVRQRRGEGRAVGQLTPTDILRLLQRQNYRCAVSGMDLDPEGFRDSVTPHPWSASLDRIISAGAYETANVRVVCAIVNYAMNAWGEQPLDDLVEHMARRKGMGYVAGNTLPPLNPT